jgi:hypothetical protein
MLFDMLTADAASKHGHEFSDPQPARWLVPRKSPFKVFPYTTRNKLANRARSGRGTMGDLKEEPEEPEDAEEKLRPQISIAQLRIPGAFHDPPSPPLRPPTEEIPSESIDDSPPSPVLLSPVEVPQPSPEKRCHRSKTRYSFAHPPPTGVQLRKKGIIRPRTLFQLHTQTSSGFHRPAYEVLPLNLLPSNNTIMQGLKRLGKGKLALGAKDLVIIKADHYKTAEENLKDLASRDVVGILSASQIIGDDNRRSAQLVIDGSSWTISQTRKDVYDLSNTLDKSQCARWYIPKSQKRSSIGSPIGHLEPKFYFAPILPSMKKHPTVASMSKSFLDIYDSFTAFVPHYTSDDHHSDISQPVPSSSGSNSSQITSHLSETPVVTKTDEVLRRLIVVSAVWITFCEGWSPLMAADAELKPTAAAPSTATPKRTPSIQISQDVITPTSATPGSGTLRSKSLLVNLRRSKPVETPSAKILPDPSTIKREVESRAPTQHENTPVLNTPQPMNVDATPLTQNGKQPIISIQTPVAPELNATSSPSPDPTAQFRHLLTMDLPHSPTSSSPVSRFESIVRRRSTHASPSISRESSRNRSVSWTRHLSIHPNSRIRDLRASSQSTSRASSDHDAHSIDASQDQHSETNGTSSARSVTPPVSPSPQNWKSPPIGDVVVAASQPDTQANLPDQQPEPEVVTVASTQEHSENTSAHSKRLEDNQQPVLFIDTELSRPSSSEGSDEGLHGVIGGPYWREFDRIQTKAFVQRSEQLQHSEPVRRHAHFLEDEKQVTVTENMLPQEENGDPLTENESSNGRTKWFSGIRRSVSRRRRSVMN